MEDLFQKSIVAVDSWIKKAANETLLTEDFFNELFTHTKLIAPTIDKENISTSLGSEPMSFNNVPPGVSFYPGEPMDFVSFGVPIKGDTAIFQKRFKHFLSNNDRIVRITNKVLYIKEYSQISLLNNDKAIDNVKTSAIQKINVIEKSLSELAEDFEGFNNGTLKQEIRIKTQQEVENRKQKDETLDKLKLF